MQTNPETLTKQRNTFLATYALRQPAGGTQTGLLLTQGEAMLRNTASNSLLGGFLLGSETLLREVTVRTGSAGATAHISRLSDTAAISLESGDATLTLYPPRNVTAAATTLQLKAGEVARFNGDGQLLGVYFGSLSGKLGKAGDPIRLERPDGLTAYPLWAPRLSGSNMPARLGMSPQDYLAAQLGASVSQQADGTLKLSLPGTSLSVFPQGSLAAISTGASQFNTDGSYHFSSPLLQLDVTAVLQDMTRFAPLLLQSGLQTQITSNGLLQLQSSNPASASTFLLGRPQLGYSTVPAIVPTSIAVDGQGIVHWHNGQGASQLIYPVFHDLAFITEAAEKGGWFVSPSGEGRLTLSNAAGAEYLLRPGLPGPDHQRQHEQSVRCLLGRLPMAACTCATRQFDAAFHAGVSAAIPHGMARCGAALRPARWRGASLHASGDLTTVSSQLPETRLKSGHAMRLMAAGAQAELSA